MKILSITDRAEVSGTRRTADGYLVAECRVARSGIQSYYGHEIGEGAPNQEFKVYRPADEVFRADSLASYSNKPVTLNHPADGVTPDNFRKEAIGHIGSEIVRDGEYVKVPLVLMDAAAISAVEGGTREISMGYECSLIMEAGTTPDGQTYDAYQREIRINHLAVVPAGRAGPQCRIGDSARQTQQQKGQAMKTVTIDGKAFEVADEVAAALTKAQADAKSTLDALKDGLTVFDQAKTLVADLKAQKEAADKAAADSKAEADKAKAESLTADQVKTMASELSAVRDAAKIIAPSVETKDLSAADIKTAVVKSIAGEDAVKDKSADYIAATFDLLAKSAKDADPVAAAIRSGTSTGDAGGAARKTYLDNLSNAWKQ